MVVPKSRVVAEFLHNASTFFKLAPSDGKQRQRNLDDVVPTSRIHLYPATPLSLGLREVSAEESNVPKLPSYERTCWLHCFRLLHCFHGCLSVFQIEQSQPFERVR